MLWKEKEKSRIRAVQMDNLRGLLGIRRIYRVSAARIRELCAVTKGVDQRIEEGVLRWFGYVERMENDRIAKVVYAGECVGSHSVGRPRKRRTVQEREVWMSGQQGEWCKIGVNGGACEGD